MATKAGLISAINGFITSVVNITKHRNSMLELVNELFQTTTIQTITTGTDVFWCSLRYNNLANITISGVNFTLPLTGVVVANGSYYLNIDNGLFKSSFGEVYQGISNTTDWAFVVSSGEYSNTEYNNEYLLN